MGHICDGAHMLTAGQQRTKAKDARVRRVLRIVIKAGLDGIGLRQLMAQTGYTRAVANHYLRDLAVRGLIECSNRGSSACVWGPPGTWAHHQSARDRTEKARMKIAARRAVCAADRVAAIEFESPVIKRLVAASAAPRLHPRGPASVWGLAL